MSFYIIKKRTANNFLNIFFSFLYGIFIVTSLHTLARIGSGDILSYVNFFENIDIVNTFNEYSARPGDGIFRLGVVFLGDLFNIEPLTVLSLLAFSISFISFLIYSFNIRSEKYLIYILPLFLMIFFTPMVSNLFASGIRSGIAYTFLFLGFIYGKGVTKLIFFGLSGLVHLSMLPIIALYFLFHFYEKLKIKSSFILPFLLIMVSALLIVAAAYLTRTNITPNNASLAYNFMIFYLAILITFVNKNAYKDPYGFISISLVHIYLIGLIFDLSFIRYVGNAILLYLLFLIRRGEGGTIQVFTSGYAPFFLVTLYFTISNTL